MRQAQGKEREREERRKGQLPEGCLLGDTVKSRMTVIRFRVGRYRLTMLFVLSIRCQRLCAGFSYALPLQVQDRLGQKHSAVEGEIAMEGEIFLSGCSGEMEEITYCNDSRKNKKKSCQSAAAGRNGGKKWLYLQAQVLQS